MTGKFILVVGPSGSGKDTLIQHIRPLFPEILFPKSCVTRAMRPGEIDGKTYYFLTKEAFEDKIVKGQFLEWAEYGGNFYGTLNAEVMPIVESGKVALKELEVQGARQIREKIAPEKLAIIFIDAGPWSEVEVRIRGRAPITEEELSKRKERYEDEISFMKEADIVVQNRTGKVEQAKKDFEAAIRSIVGTLS